MHRPGLRAAFAVGVAVLTGCSAKVYGAPDPGAGGGTATSASGSPSSSASSGSSADTCKAFCEAIVPSCYAAGFDQCFAECTALASYYASCAAEFADMLACTDANLGMPDCSPDACDDETVALRDCAHPPGSCGEAACTQTSLLTCDIQCGPNQYETLCPIEPPYACECRLDGQTLGTCTDFGSSTGECCTVFFTAPK
jgi:hypothetical protein